MARKSLKSRQKRFIKYLRLNKPKVVVLAVLVLILLAGISIAARNKTTPTPTTTAPTTGGSAQNKVNYGPPTDAQKQDSDQHKQAIVQQQDAQKNTNSSAVSVTPIITSQPQQIGPGDTASVSAFVQGVAEDGGTCTLTATKSGSTSVVVNNPAIMNASTTNCKNFSVPYPSFGSTGTWSITVSYKSSTSSGISQTQSLEVK